MIAREKKVAFLFRTFPINRIAIVYLLQPYHSVWYGQIVLVMLIKITLNKRFYVPIFYKYPHHSDTLWGKGCKDMAKRVTPFAPDIVTLFNLGPEYF